MRLPRTAAVGQARALVTDVRQGAPALVNWHAPCVMVSQTSGPWRSRSAFARWWLRSRVFDGVYIATAAAGTVVFCLAAVDSAVSWPRDRVLLAPARLESLAGWLLLPFWVVLILSMVGLLGLPRPSSKSPFLLLSVRRRVAAVVLAVALLAFSVGGFVGGAKGSLRVLPGPRYQVSTLDLNLADWTTVSPAGYRMWQARFVRGDTVLTMFGAFELVAGVVVLRIRRRARLAAAVASNLPN